MAGHNKWAQIKHKKAITDAKKSKIFSKFSRLILLESKKSQGKESPSLRAVVERARAVNMPSENIERAIKKGVERETRALEEITYEAYGPGGAALIIDCLTDNRNRTVNEIKLLLSEYGLSLAEPGAALWAFEKTLEKHWIPKTTVPISVEDKNRLNALIEKLEDNDDVQSVYTNSD